jgi:hypothetical protein
MQSNINTHQSVCNAAMSQRADDACCLQEAFAPYTSKSSTSASRDDITAEQQAAQDVADADKASSSSQQKPTPDAAAAGVSQQQSLAARCLAHMQDAWLRGPSFSENSSFELEERVQTPPACERRSVSAEAACLLADHSDDVDMTDANTLPSSQQDAASPEADIMALTASVVADIRSALQVLPTDMPADDDDIVQTASISDLDAVMAAADMVGILPTASVAEHSSAATHAADSLDQMICRDAAPPAPAKAAGQQQQDAGEQHAEERPSSAAEALTSTSLGLLEVPVMPPASHSSLCDGMLQQALQQCGAAAADDIIWSEGLQAPFSFEELVARDMQLEDDCLQLPITLFQDDVDQVGMMQGHLVLHQCLAAVV